MPSPASRDLRLLVSTRDAFGVGGDESRVELLGRLESASLPRADEVLALHEVLCFLRAYPESREVLGRVERMLATFADRRDLRRHRAALADTGVAGTGLNFRFYFPMAARLVQRWPDALTIDWKAFENAPRLAEMLHLLVPYSETPALDAFDFTPKDWVQRLKGPHETDAAFLVRRFEALASSLAATEHIYDELDVPLTLQPGPTTPARGRERWSGATVHWQRDPLDRARPSLREVARTASLDVRELSASEGRELVDLANAAMVPRHRDLLVFLHADENDVRIVDCGDGLQFACIGTRPEHRLLLEAVYGFLTLKNGVPIGYVLNSALFGSCELAYNVFPTFRGGEAARIYGLFVAAVHRLFGADAFTIDPYQLGHGNDEAQASGAWWFYYKLGFRPHDEKLREMAKKELARVTKDPSHRTTPARLQALSAGNMDFFLGRPRRAMLGRVSLGNIGLRVSRLLAERFGSDRERGIRVCSEESARLLGLRRIDTLPAGERLAWERWSPLILAVPGVASWSTTEKREAAAVILAKGGRRESDFVLLFDAHAPLRRGLLRLAAEG